MSLGDARIPENKAEQKAEVELRLNVGNLPHLGESTYIEESNEYVFPIVISLPRVIFEEGEERPEPVDVRFLSDKEIGTIHVDAAEGEITDRTNADTINKQIREEKQAIEEAVQKALIKASAKEFSRLPYPEHRYTPVQDILSEIILSGFIDREEIHTFSEDDQEKYQNHLQTLIDVGLVRWQGDQVIPDDALATIETRKTKPHQKLNAAMVHLFEMHSDNLGMMHEILGPHLKVAGYYYQRALVTEGLPKIRKEDFERQFAGATGYSGEKGRLMRFKLSRYLVELEEVGLLKSEAHLGDRVWIGDMRTKEKVLEQREALGPIGEILA